MKQKKQNLKKERALFERLIYGEKMKKKHDDEPAFVREWREGKGKQAPRCCFTCGFLSKIDAPAFKGKCTFFNQVPPEEFKAQVDAYERWLEDIPF